MNPADVPSRFSPFRAFWPLMLGLFLLVGALALRNYRDRSPQAFRMQEGELAWLESAPHWAPALQAIRQGDYPSASRILEAHLEDHPHHIEALYQLGLCYLETGREEESARLMETVRYNDTLYYPEATWHLALARLKQGRQGESRVLLRELMEGPDLFYEEKARVVLEQIFPL
jgi:thioredoxin-like negative regulator of GroEL